MREYGMGEDILKGTEVTKVTVGVTRVTLSRESSEDTRHWVTLLGASVTVILVILSVPVVVSQGMFFFNFFLF